MNLTDCQWSCQLTQASLWKGRVICQCRFQLTVPLGWKEGMHCCLPIDNTLPEVRYFLIRLLVAFGMSFLSRGFRKKSVMGFTPVILVVLQSPGNSVNSTRCM